MLTLKPSVWLMGGFIALVIVAGLFGPWLISLILAMLVAACAISFATTNTQS